MAIEITLPLGKKQTTKNLVFSILTKEYPLKIIELTNYIKKRYGKSITFQAVRKAVLELTEEEVLIKKSNSFQINKKWILESKEVLEKIYKHMNTKKIKPQNLDSIKGEISVFTFSSLNELMKFWQEIIDNWYKKIKKGEPHINCYQAAHAWEGLLHLDKEKELMGQLKKKGIKSYILSTGNSQLDKNIKKFYKSLGIKMIINTSSSTFDKGYYVGTYGDTIVQTKYPIKLVKELDIFFKKNKSLKSLNLAQLSDIVNRKIKIKLTVIKNLEMAKQINYSILSQIE